MNGRRHKYLARLYELRFELGFVLVIAFAFFFRLWRLDSVAPGLDGLEAAQALKALDVVQHPRAILQAFGAGVAGGVFTLLEALAIRVLGPTIVAARLVPALGGILGVVAVYGWITTWFNKRAGLVAGLIAATTPWLVTLSRINTPASFVIFGLAATLWAGTLAVRHNDVRLAILAGLSAALMLQARSAWVLVIFLGIAAIRQLAKVEFRRKYSRLILAGGVMLLLAAPLVFTSIKIFHKPHFDTLKNEVLSGVGRVSDTALSYGWRGDANFRYNIAGTPMFNLFIALMIMIGLLVCASRSRTARYRWLLILFGASIVASGLASTDTPSALGSYITASLAIALAAVGIEYMLETWFNTFPINAAARTLGTLPIVLLLLITVYQGYRQYFVAWTGSPEVYDVYNERAKGIADYMVRSPYDGQRYALLQDGDADIVAYLTYRKATYSLLRPREVSALPKDNQPRQFIMIAAPSSDVLVVLKGQYPKARLSQHYSSFNDNNELFSVYETKP